MDHWSEVCKARFDNLVDDFEALFEVGEGALHRVDRDPLKVIKRPAEGIGALCELSSHRGVAHQAVVGIERHAESKSSQHADGVLGNRLAYAGVDV